MSSDIRKGSEKKITWIKKGVWVEFCVSVHFTVVEDPNAVRFTTVRAANRNNSPTVRRTKKLKGGKGLSRE
jgi:hypothetical protein